MLWCGEGKTLDPTKGCSCISTTEYESIFPEWATRQDIRTSLTSGRSYRTASNDNGALEGGAISK